MTLVLLTLVVTLTLWFWTQSLTKTAIVHKSSSKRTSAAELSAYFVNAERLRFKPIEETVACIGPWDNYDDWDWGRVIYHWHQPTFRVMVMTQSGQIRKIALLDPADSSRFGVELKLLLDEPFDIELQGHDQKQRPTDLG